MATRRQKSGHKKIAKRFSRFSRKVSKASDNSAQHIQENIVQRIGNVRQVRLLIVEWAFIIIVILALAITQAVWYRESYATKSFTSGGTYTEATLGKVNSLNPLFATTSSEKALSRLMFSTLTTIDYSGHTGLALASAVTPDELGKNWTVSLRPGLKWSDGTDITNEDVLYTVRTIQDQKVNTSYSSSLSGVKLTEENGQLVFTLPTAYANFAASLNFPILPAHILKDVPADHLLEHAFSTTSPVTSGAFAYNATQAIGTEGEKIVYMTANPNNYQGASMLDSFAIHAFLDISSIKTALSNGSVTATTELSIKDADTLTTGDITEKQTPLSSGVFAFLNTASPTLGNVKIRKAIQQGLDMKSLRAPLRDESPLNYPILDRQITINNWPAIPEYDPTAAKATIAEASPNAPPEISLATVNTGYLPTLADNLEIQLTGLGFKVDKRILDPGQDFLISVIRPRAYDILLYEVELGVSPDLFPYYHSSQASPAGLNLSNYNNKLADALILGARSSMNESIRNTRYETFLKYWVDDVPAIAIYQTNLSYLYNKNVRTFSDEDHLVSPTDRFNNVEYWATETATKSRTP